jgi:hypothetical protein
MRAVTAIRPPDNIIDVNDDIADRLGFDLLDIVYGWSFIEKALQLVAKHKAPLSC